MNARAVIATWLLACGFAGATAVTSCVPKSNDLSGKDKPSVKPVHDAGKPSLPSFDAGTDPERNAVGPGELCDRLSVIQCAAEGACCTKPGRDYATCLDALARACAADLLFDQIAGQTSAGFDQDQARVVLDQFEQLASECDPSVATFGVSQDGLRSMFRGTIAPGGNCRPSNVLDKVMGGAALSACTSSEDQACLPSSTTWLCTERAGAGGKCFTNINCLPGFYCPNPDLDLAGASCMEDKAEGEDCAAHNECESLYCVGGKCVPADQQLAYCPE